MISFKNLDFKPLNVKKCTETSEELFKICIQRERRGLSQKHYTCSYEFDASNAFGTLVDTNSGPKNPYN